MTIPDEVKKDLLGSLQSGQLRRDMEGLRKLRGSAPATLNPDDFIRFAVQYNAFISHRPRPFRRMVDDDMRL